MATIVTDHFTIERDSSINWFAATTPSQIQDLLMADNHEYELCGGPVNYRTGKDLPDTPLSPENISAAVEIRQITHNPSGAVQVSAAVTSDEDAGYFVCGNAHVLTARELTHVQKLDTEPEHYLCMALPETAGAEQLYLYGSGYSD